MQHKPSIFLISGVELKAPPLEPGLYIVSTPIGNLGDITIRALETLAAADIIAAEDTRVSRILLDRYGIRQRPVSYHEHNADAAAERLLAAIGNGKSVAQISDAGTPLISDPGFRLVLRAIAEGIRVIPVPGASAILGALTASGLPTDAFFFAGFLPNKGGPRAERLRELSLIPGTLVFYESPQRLAASLQQMCEIFGGGRQAVVAREITKRFEELRRETLSELAAFYEKNGAPKGEVVLCVGAATGKMELDIDSILIDLAKDMSASKAAGEAAKITERPKAELYKRLLQLKGSGDG